MLKSLFAGAFAATAVACVGQVAPTAEAVPDFAGLSGLDASKPSADTSPEILDIPSDFAVPDAVTQTDTSSDAAMADDLSADVSEVSGDSQAVDDGSDGAPLTDAQPVDANPDGEQPELDLGNVEDTDQPEETAATDADTAADEVAPLDAKAADATVDSWTAPPGGQPGSGCFGQDGTVTCSPDGKYRVECNNGAWTAIQHCGFGVCGAALSPGGGIVTTCGVPKAKHTAANDACARYTKCFGGPSHETCVRGVLATAAFTAGLPTGKPVAVADLAFAGIADNLACAAAALTCPALAECLYFFAQPKCPTASAGCTGDVAWQCLGGAPLAVHCKGLGMACVAGGGAAQCIASAPCSAAGQVSCKDGIASKCSTLVDGKQWTEKTDCSAVQGSCQQGASSLASACAGQPEMPCEAKDFVASCKDGAALTCVSGDTVKTPCGAGLVCAVENQFALFEKACPEGQGCTVALCTEGGSCSAKAKCNGSEVWFCEAKQPVAYDCKTKGMSCTTGPTGPRCQ